MLRMLPIRPSSKRWFRRQLLPVLFPISPFRYWGMCELLQAAANPVQIQSRGMHTCSTHTHTHTHSDILIFYASTQQMHMCLQSITLVIQLDAITSQFWEFQSLHTSRDPVCKTFSPRAFRVVRFVKLSKKLKLGKTKRSSAVVLWVKDQKDLRLLQ